MLCMGSFDARACYSINGSADGTYKRSDDLQLTDLMCRELTKRYTERNKGILCPECAECLRGVMEPPLMLVRGILLLIRRDCGRDFFVEWNGDVLDLSAVTIENVVVPLLKSRSTGRTFLSENLAFRAGCKAHSCWDQRVQLLGRRLANLPVGAGDGDMLAYAKHYIGSGFKLNPEKTAAMEGQVLSDRLKKNAEEALGNAESVAKYVRYSGDEDGCRAYLGMYVLMALLTQLHRLTMPTFMLIRRTLDTWFETSWGPAAAVNYMLGANRLRYYSPQSERHNTSSVRDRDKRLVSACFMIMKHTDFGHMVASVYKAMGVPHSYAATLSFPFCELRKYYGPNVNQYREMFQDSDARAALRKELQKYGEDVDSFLFVDSDDDFVTESDAD